MAKQFQMPENVLKTVGGTVPTSKPPTSVAEVELNKALHRIFQMYGRDLSAFFEEAHRKAIGTQKHAIGHSVKPKRSK
jgi:hypothetical protein